MQSWVIIRQPYLPISKFNVKKFFSGANFFFIYKICSLRPLIFVQVHIQAAFLPILLRCTRRWARWRALHRCFSKNHFCGEYAGPVICCVLPSPSQLDNWQGSMPTEVSVQAAINSRACGKIFSLNYSMQVISFRFRITEI